MVFLSSFGVFFFLLVNSTVNYDLTEISTDVTVDGLGRAPSRGVSW